MNEKTNLWNTKANELTVGDSVKLSVLSPIIVMGGMVLAGSVIRAMGSLTKKIRKSPTSIDETITK